MTETRTRTRMKVLAALVVFMFAALTTRLWFLQVLAAPQFSKLANDNQVRLVPIDPLRGEILDRNGNVLVENTSTTAIVVNRQALGDEKDAVLIRLSALLNVPLADIQKRVDSVRYLPYQPVPIAENISPQVIFFIREHQKQFPGVGYLQVPVREYPEGTLAAHILGYLGEINQKQLDSASYQGYQSNEVVGQAGVEASYEHDLHGTPGERAIQVDAQGRILNENFRTIQPEAGDNLVLSIDDNVQRLAEQSLAIGIRATRQVNDPITMENYKATGGAVIVMDPKTGQVLALASNPTYDPSVYVGGISQSDFDHLQDPALNLPGFDRAVQGQYPPGSTFKPFVAAGAFHQGFATPQGSYNCPGQYIVPGDTSGTVFHNWFTGDLGYMNIAQALTISCDTVFYKIGYQYWVRYFDHGKRDADLMQKDLQDMGFGHPSGIDLPRGAEAPGIIPTPEYTKKVYEHLKEVYGSKAGPYYGWLPGDNVNMSIGQGFVQATPLQMAVGFSALANGGKLLVPHLAWQVRTPEGKVVRTIQPEQVGKLPITKDQVAYIRQGLTGVPISGTAKNAFLGFPLSQVPVAGKTGTADILGKQPTSWFASMAPANDPKYVIVCMVEQGGHGATSAVPIVRRILEGLFGLGTSGKINVGGTTD